MIRKYRIAVNVKGVGEHRYLTYASNKSLALEKVKEFLRETGVIYNTILSIEHLKPRRCTTE